MKGNRPLISVIIPTFNRASYLRESLESLTHQTLPQEYFEVIVIDDASTPETRTVCESFQTSLPLKYHRLGTNSGISAAKNLGVFRASGDILFFFDDDDVADKELLSEHLKTHLEYPEEHVAVLGYTTWSQTLKVTQVMNYITEIGQFLFSYPNLKDGQELGVQYFWGGRSSCKRSLLVQHGIFNQAFRFGSEDIELGYRLLKFGLKVIYNKKAVSYMIRPITYDEFCRRCERQGFSQVYFSKLHAEPEVQKYCQVIDAREKWEYVRQTLEQKVAQVHEIESFVYTVPRSDKAGMAKAMSLLPRLGDLYWWTFNAFKLKGIVQAMEEYTQAQTSATSAVPAAPDDVEYIREKWSRLNLPSKCAGNVLVIDPTLPWFDRAAGSLRLFHILLSLKRLGYHVTYIARNPAHAEQYVPILQQLGIEVYAGDPTALATMGDKEIHPYLDFEKVITSRQYDLAILSFWDIADYYMPLVRKYSPASKVVIDTVDIHFVRELRQAELKNDKKEKAAALARKERELAVYKQADRLWVVTENDKKAIEPHVGEIPFDIIPTIHPRVDVQKSFDRTSNLLFVGNFNHTPNRDALLFFCREVLPRIKKQLAGVKLYVVGNDPPKDIWALASDSVIVKGYVPDLAPYLNQARVSVVPLRFGAGIKGKIGEALSWGLPVVCTSVAAEGMNLKHGKDVLIADRPEKFAEEVVRLYSTPDLWNSLSKNGKVKVQQEWSPEVIGTRLEEVFREIAPSRADKTASIILLAYNQWKYTQECLESLSKHTRARHEIIVVDNASTDGTLQGLLEYPEVRLIRNTENLGFPAGVNQGIHAALGEYIILLNNDTVVTDGWLERLVEVAESDGMIGIVGPMSNSVSGPQQDDDAAYRGIDAMPDYAAKVRREHKGEILHIPRVAFLCTLIKRKLIEAIGGLDERFTPGNFEDDDFCLRAQLAGFKTVVAKDVFIHHYGSKSFGVGGRDAYTKRIETNRQVFIAKWGADPIEIWKNKTPFKRRNLKYPLHNDTFVQSIERAKILIEEKELTLALPWLKNALKDFHSSAHAGSAMKFTDVLNLTGNVAVALNDLETAEACYKQEMELSSDKARAKAGLDNVRRSIEHGQVAYEIVPVSKEPGRQASDVEVQQVLAYAELLSHSGQIADAAKILREAIGALPDNSTLYRTLAWLFIKNKMFDDASMLIQATPDSIKKNVEWLEIAGYCTEGQGFDDVATQCADKALELTPASPGALTLKGILAAKAGNGEEATNLFLQAIQHSRDLAAPKVHLGVQLWQRGETEEGYRLLAEAFVLEPTDAEIAVTYYRAAESLDRLQEAQMLFQQASAKYPVHKQLRHFVADVLARQGKYSEAMEAIEDAITLFGIEGDILSFAREVRETLGAKEIHRPNGEHETLSLCMIVKNEEQFLARCLSSVKALVDEMIVVDTGSTDRTKEIAGVFGAKVFEFTWTDSFADARNFSLSKAEGDWILVLDGDEVISAMDLEKLEGLLSVARRQKHKAYSFVTRNYVHQTGTQGWIRNDGKYGEEAGTGWIPSTKVRLFPRLGSIEFRGVVHELVESSLQESKVKVHQCDIPIHHYGKLDTAKSRDKGHQYLKLGEKKLEETSHDDIKALSELAIQENEFGNYQRALEILKRVVELDPMNAHAHMGVGSNLIGLKQFEKAVNPLKSAIKLAPDLSEAYIRISIAYLAIGRAAESLPGIRCLVKTNPDYPYSKAMFAAVLFCVGEKEKALATIAELKGAGTAFEPFFADLARQLKDNGRTEYAVALLEPLYESGYITQESGMLLVECYKSQALV